jgi:phosphatidylserine decarboxylase
MMTIHKEGRTLLFWMLLLLSVGNFLLFYYLPEERVLFSLSFILSTVIFLLFLQFFRHPIFPIPQDKNLVFAPADGKIVVIEEAFESEYLKDKRKQVSIFMSPFNVHVNRAPIAGTVDYFRYHPGKYLAAWHPKSSTENERTSMVIRDDKGTTLMVRQIAGALARRIKWYVSEGSTLQQGEEFGFIKFGSRVDIFLPLDAEILCQMDQVTKGARTPIARLKN